MRFTPCALCVAALVFHAGVASGYCRTTTSHAPAGYDPASNGCWTSGTALTWSLQRVPYAISSAASQQISLSEATRVAHLAFGAWTGAACNGRGVGIQAYDAGPVTVSQTGFANTLASWASCSDSTSCNPKAHDVIVFDDDGWPYNDPANTLALTTVTFGMNSGHIFQAYTEINSAEQALTTEEPPPEGSQAYDLQAVLTHEAGHFLGLAHATDTGAIMYAFYKPGAIQLTTDDVGGICNAYPPGWTPSNTSADGSNGGGGYDGLGCSCDAVGTSPGGSDVVAVVSVGALLLLGASRRRRAMHRP